MKKSIYKRIAFSQDAKEFANQIIAYKPNSPYYGSSDIPNYGRDYNDVIYARVGNIVIKGDDPLPSIFMNNKGVHMYMFTKPNSNHNMKSLANSTLNQLGEGYLMVRHTSKEEIERLKHLVEKDKLELVASRKEETLEFLTNYLSKETHPEPYVWYKSFDQVWHKLGPDRNESDSSEDEMNIVGKNLIHDSI